MQTRARKEWGVLWGALLANLVLGGVFIWLFDLTFNQVDAPAAVMLEEPTMMPTATAAIFPTETATATGTPLPTATATLPLPTPLPTLTLAPTRRGIYEPTKPPYIFPTPIHIPPYPRPTTPRAR